MAAKKKTAATTIKNANSISEHDILGYNDDNNNNNGNNNRK